MASEHHVKEIRFGDGSVLTRANAINLAHGGVPDTENEQAVDEFMLRIFNSIAGASIPSHDVPELPIGPVRGGVGERS